MLLAVAAAAAAAFPLNTPDPDEMGTYRCKRHPVENDNNVALESRTLSDQPPGPPSYADGVQGRLKGHANDTTLRKAGKGKGNLAAPASSSLATSGRPVTLGCGGRAATQDDFVIGCKRQQACTMLIRLPDHTGQYDRAGQLGPALAPIDNPAKALGLLAMLDRDLFLPLTAKELDRWAEVAAESYRAVEPAIPWVDIEEKSRAFVVRAPRLVQCGCQHDLVRRAWWVSRDGRACQLEEMPEPLAIATDSTCID